jgi:hypothetical protein
MKNINWTFIITVFSVSLGWFLNELSQWFRTNQSDKKIKKQILFNLLEINFIFQRLDTTALSQLYKERVLIRFPEPDQTEDIKSFVDHIFQNILYAQLQNSVVDSLINIETKYSTAVENLASIDPITAYYLSGKTKIFESFDMIQNGLNDFKQLFTEDEHQMHHKIDSAYDSIIKPDVIQDAIEDLRSEILTIARSIDLWTWYKLKRKFISSYETNQEELRLKIDELLDKIIPKTI